ncbi:hypothetical protein EYF80_060319 [Liparis tanakae]|uniref:Uncharacterized protein n=1 Tax=Liparis tanakae TaxID=230148 RepID=A0A4Z2EL21_9TELE|nr:hypothetical protein EYF80_060319 [Liparis tanakae]
MNPITECHNCGVLPSLSPPAGHVFTPSPATPLNASTYGRKLTGEPEDVKGGSAPCRVALQQHQDLPEVEYSHQECD